MKKFLKKIANIFPLRRRKKSKAVDFIDLIDESDTPWWGTFRVDEEQSRYSKIGHIVLCIDHYNKEWRITCHSEQDPEKYPTRTFDISILSTEINIKPLLYDRSLVTTLERPLFLPVNQEVIVYACSPALISLSIGNPPNMLTEIPTEVLTDTWFGKNTLEGELCYAGREARFRVEDLHRDCTHVVTPISLMNNGSRVNMIQDLKIPLTQLSIYQDPQNHLWTEQLSMVFEDELSTTSILRNVARDIKDLSLLTPARNKVKQRFGGIFSFGE